MPETKHDDLPMDEYTELSVDVLLENLRALMKERVRITRNDGPFRAMGEIQSVEQHMQAIRVELAERAEQRDGPSPIGEENVLRETDAKNAVGLMYMR